MRSTPPEPGARHHLPLTGQGGVGDPPAVVDLADPLRVGHPGAVEEHLVEVDLAADVAQRPDVDPGLVHVDEEVGDAAALRDVGVGARQQHREVGEEAPGGPDLLAGDDPLVAVAHRPGWPATPGRSRRPAR